MERLSNKYSDLHNELKIELSTIDLNSDQHCVVKYIEIPWFPGGQISLSLVEDKLKHTYSLIEKAWNNDYDTKRFSTGIFNLDRLCIKTREIPLPIDRQKEYQNIINNLFFFPETLEKQDYIMLDGIEYELKISTSTVEKNYKWKLATDDLKYFERLITFMKIMARE